MASSAKNGSVMHCYQLMPETIELVPFILLSPKIMQS
uniref:Myophilin n=1 Tax=Triatoma infestans TaxID=30076 RepID=A0A170ZFT0_TRIIF